MVLFIYSRIDPFCFLICDECGVEILQHGSCILYHKDCQILKENNTIIIVFFLLLGGTLR